MLVENISFLFCFVCFFITKLVSKDTFTRTAKKEGYAKKATRYLIESLCFVIMSRNYNDEIVIGYVLD